MNRVEKKRIDREFDKELKKIKSPPGLGRGWRYSCLGRNKCPVNEFTKSTDIDYLEKESIRKQEERGIICLEY